MKIGLKKVVIVSCVLLFLSFLFGSFMFLPPRLRTQTAMATVTGLNQPFGVAVTPNGEYIYVTNGGRGSVSVISTATNTVNATVHVGTGPFGVDITPDGKYVYVANGGSASVSVIDTATNTVTETIRVGIGPYGLGIAPDGKHVYVANFGTSTVSVISTASNMVVDTISVGYNPQGAVVTPNGKYVYVANFADATVSVISTSLNTVVDTIHVECGPVDVGFTPNSDYAYVTNSGSGSISVIDTATNTVIERITEFAQPSGIDLTLNGAYAYVANHDIDTVSVIDTATNTVVATAIVGIAPYDIAITPNDEYAYVVNYYSAEASVINVLPIVSVSPSPHVMNDSRPETITATPSGGSGSYKSYQWYVNGSVQPDATTSTFNFVPTSNGSYSITATVTDSLNATSAQSTATTVTVPWTNTSRTSTPSTTTPTLTTLTVADQFLVPEHSSSIHFAENGTYSKATFENNAWTFSNLRLNESQILKSFQVSAKNSNVTIISYVRTQNSTFQNERLAYVAENQGEQIFNFDISPETEELDHRYEWGVINNNVSLAKGNDWYNLYDGTIIVNGVSGNVIIERYALGDFFGNGEAYANLPFSQQHSVSITIVATLTIVVVVAVLVKMKTKDQS